MAKDKLQGVNIELPKFRMSYPNLFKKAVIKGKDAGYMVDALFDKETDLTVLKNAITQAKKLTFGKNKDKWPKVVSCIKDGDEVQDKESYQGKLFIKLKSKVRKPTIVDIKKQPVDDESEVFGGRNARAAVFVTIVKSGNDYYAVCYINAIQLLKGGESFGGGVNTDNLFNEGNDDDDESTDDSDDSSEDDSDDDDEDL